MTLAMDQLEEYFRGCERIAQFMASEDQKNPLQYCHELFQRKDSNFLKLLNTRKSFIDHNDYLTNSGLISTGFFKGGSVEERLSGYCVVSVSAP